MAKLFLMCGYPGSGKSTFVKNHLEEDSQAWVSRDAIRFSLVKETEAYFSKETLVFNTFVDTIIDCLSNDYDVFADATHLTRASRAKLIRRIPTEYFDELNIIWVKVDLSTAVAQNENRINTRAYVPPKELRRMGYTFTAPDLDEGFDNIYIVEPDKPVQIISKE